MLSANDNELSFSQGANLIITKDYSSFSPVCILKCVVTMKLLKYTVIHSTYSMKSDKTHGFIELTFNNFFSYLFDSLGMAQHYELGIYKETL